MQRGTQAMLPEGGNHSTRFRGWLLQDVSITRDFFHLPKVDRQHPVWWSFAIAHCKGFWSPSTTQFWPFWTLIVDCAIIIQEPARNFQGDTTCRVHDSFRKSEFSRHILAKNRKSACYCVDYIVLHCEACACDLAAYMTNPKMDCFIYSMKLARCSGLDPTFSWLVAYGHIYTFCTCQNRSSGGQLSIC